MCGEAPRLPAFATRTLFPEPLLGHAHAQQACMATKQQHACSGARHTQGVSGELQREARTMGRGGEQASSAGEQRRRVARARSAGEQLDTAAPRHLARQALLQEKGIDT